MEYSIHIYDRYKGTVTTLPLQRYRYNATVTEVPFQRYRYNATTIYRYRGTVTIQRYRYNLYY